MSGRRAQKLDLESTVRLDERVYRTQLSGGPLVLSERVPGVRSVSVGIWLRWGAGHESPAQLGISHLLEHMVFKGTRGRTAREIALTIEGIGGSLDAYTTREHTAYHARVLDSHLHIAIDVLTDLVFQPALRPEDLDLERRVILEEIAGVEDTPEELLFDLFSGEIWGDHPYGRPVLGTRETVRSIEIDDLRDLWRQVYRPGACVVAAAGNLEHQHLLQLVGEHFPPGGDAGSLPAVPRPDEVRAERSDVRRDSAQVHIAVGTTTFAQGDPRREALVLVSSTIGGGMSSRLFQRIREEMGLAYTVYSYQSFYAHGGLTGVYLATRPDAADEAVDTVMEELGRLEASGLPADDLRSAKEQVKGQVMLSLESTSSRLHRLAGVAVFDEPYRTLDELCQRVDAVTVEDVAELCATYFAPERQTLVLLGPDRGGSA